MNTIQKSCLAACIAFSAFTGTMNASDGFLLPDSFKKLREVPFFAFKNPLSTTVVYINHSGEGSATRISSRPFTHTTQEKTGDDRLQRKEVADDINKEAHATKARKSKKNASKNKRRKKVQANRPMPKNPTPSPEKRLNAAQAMLAFRYRARNKNS